MGTHANAPLSLEGRPAVRLRQTVTDVMAPYPWRMPERVVPGHRVGCASRALSPGGAR